MASQVAWSAMPVTGKPMNRWNSDTARRVVRAKIPSGMTIGRRGSAMEMTRSMVLEASDALILERFFRSHRTTSRTTRVQLRRARSFPGIGSARSFPVCGPARGQGQDRCPALDGEILSGPEGGIFNAGILIVDGLPGSVVHFRSPEGRKTLGCQHGGTGTTAVNAVHRGGGDGGNKRGQYRQPILQQPDLFSAAAHL